MVEQDRRYARNLLGKTVVTKSGKKFGEAGNISFEPRTGELMHVVIKNPTNIAHELNLEKDDNGNIMVPYSSIIAIGDFIVVSEEDIL